MVIVSFEQALEKTVSYEEEEPSLGEIVEEDT
jgi:hypothetical protein